MVGMQDSDDAGVYRLSDDTCLVQTADFITPVVDDPYDFGWIAAANSLSDVYAMGGIPITCLNLVCFDNCNLNHRDLRRILEGASEAVTSANAVIVGGHTVEAPEMKFGLSVTGTVHPDQLIRNSRARPGDQLILTKMLGTGIITTAHKAEMASADSMKQVTTLMKQLNDRAARLMSRHKVHAATDITGFGLLGHALEMARASGVTLQLDMERVPLLEEAVQLAAIGMIPAGTHANLQHVQPFLSMNDNIDPDRLMVLADAQTSGGLLMAVPSEERAALLQSLDEERISATHMGVVVPLAEYYLQLDS